MSDEDINNDILEDGDNQDISNDVTPTEDISNDSPSDNTQTTSITYCTEEDIVNLFGDNVSDTIETDLIEGAIETATARIHNRLRANRVPLPDPENYSSAIHSAAKYWAACECYGALYNGEDYQTQRGFWCNEASEILDEYIDAYLNTCADEDEQLNHSLVRHSRARTYNEKRHRRSRL